jgi:hypothetical protein
VGDAHGDGICTWVTRARGTHTCWAANSLENAQAKRRARLSAAQEGDARRLPEGAQEGKIERSLLFSAAALSRLARLTHAAGLAVRSCFAACSVSGS